MEAAILAVVLLVIVLLIVAVLVLVAMLELSHRRVAEADERRRIADAREKRALLRALIARSPQELAMLTRIDNEGDDLRDELGRMAALSLLDDETDEDVFPVDPRTQEHMRPVGT